MTCSQQQKRGTPIRRLHVHLKGSSRAAAPPVPAAAAVIAADSASRLPAWPRLTTHEAASAWPLRVSSSSRNSSNSSSTSSSSNSSNSSSSPASSSSGSNSNSSSRRRRISSQASRLHVGSCRGRRLPSLLASLLQQEQLCVTVRQPARSDSSSSSSRRKRSRRMAATHLFEGGSEVRDFYPAVAGAVFGAASALLLSQLLIETTLSPFFSRCICLLLLVVGLLAVQRAFAIEAVPPPDLLDDEGEEAEDFAQKGGPGGAPWGPPWGFPPISSSRGPRMAHYEGKLRAKKTLHALCLLSCFGALSALLLPCCRSCCWLLRVPLYCLLGNSLCVLLVLALADGLQLYLETASTTTPTTSSGSSSSSSRERLGHVLVAAGSAALSEEGAEQLRLLLCGTLTLGGTFGFFFALTDGGDAFSHVQIVRYRYVCVPLAVLLGALFAVALNRLGTSKQQQLLLQQQGRWSEHAFVDDAAEDEPAFMEP
ncbi:hypothetical protein Esti_005817 [Eimeria stiedai]